MYRYVGPEEIRLAALGQPVGAIIRRPEDLAPWLEGEGATYVVGLDGWMRLAAGEVRFSAGPRVTMISNQSTGYCPDPACWPAVAKALSRAGVTAPAKFTYTFVFRHCRRCGELNVVKDDWFVCAHCDAELDGA